MNNRNVIKLINENGVAKEYGEIPDLWHIAQAINEGRDHGAISKEACEELAEQILHVWHMAHDLKSVIEKQEQAKLVDPAPAELPKDLGYVIELADHRAQMWADFAETGYFQDECFHECDAPEVGRMSDITRDAVDAVSKWYRENK